MLDHIPYEIFRKIIKSSYTHYTLITSFQFDNLPPIRATHVCRSWRTALLSDPTMWTSIILTDRTNLKMNLDQLNETLSRSCSAPLHVLIDITDDPHLIVDFRNMISVVSQQMHRCQQLQITIPAHVAHLVFHCLDKPVPMLQNFYLEVFEAGDKSTLDMLRGIHEILFSGHAPNLEHARLAIFGGLDNLQLSLFKNLSNLHLFFAPDAVIHCGDMLLDILQSSPCLRMLNIEWYFVMHQPVLSMPNSNRRIPLPHLRDLSLRGRCSVDIVDLVLGHLEFSTENIKFNITWDDSHISESTLLLHFLSQRRLTFLSIYYKLLNMTIDFSETQMHSQGFSGSIFGIDYDLIRAHAQHDLPKFLRAFNLSDVTHMSLGCLTMKSDILRGILVSLANLQYLCIRHDNQYESIRLRGIQSSYFRALLPRRRQRQRSSPQTRASLESDTDDSNTDSESSIETWQGQLFPCPSLRTLELRLDDIGSPVGLDEACLPALIRCSRVREQAGYPLKYIVNCYKHFQLAKDIDAWLQAHEGFPMEVRRGPR